MAIVNATDFPWPPFVVKVVNKELHKALLTHR